MAQSGWSQMNVRYERGADVGMTIEIGAIHSVFIRVHFNTRAELQIFDLQIM